MLEHQFSLLRVRLRCRSPSGQNRGDSQTEQRESARAAIPDCAPLEFRALADLIPSMDFSGTQVRPDLADRVLRNSRSGPDNKFNGRPTPRYTGRLRPRFWLGLNRSETALSGVPPITCQPHPNRPSLADFPG